jgi:hypothetical protein
MECPLYQNERYCLFRNLRETNKNIETLLFGNDEISINENSNIFNKVRAYIRQNCPLPTNNTHIIMPTKIAHTQI